MEGIAKVHIDRKLGRCLVGWDNGLQELLSNRQLAWPDRRIKTREPTYSYVRLDDRVRRYIPDSGNCSNHPDHADLPLATSCGAYKVKAHSRLIESGQWYGLLANHLATDETLRDCVVSCNELSSYRDMIRDPKATPSSIWLFEKALPKYQHPRCAMLSAILPLSTGSAIQSPGVWPMPALADQTLHSRLLCICPD